MINIENLNEYLNEISEIANQINITPNEWEQRYGKEYNPIDRISQLKRMAYVKIESVKSIINKE